MQYIYLSIAIGIKIPYSLTKHIILSDYIAPTTFTKYKLEILKCILKISEYITEIKNGGHHLKIKIDSSLIYIRKCDHFMTTKISIRITKLKVTKI